MDDNATEITFHGFVNVHMYRYFYFVIMVTVYFLIICFNITIVCIIWVHRSLHEPMYVFIAALLLNSVLFSTNIYPKLLLDFLSDTQVISHQACLLQFFLFYSLGGSEFLLLAAMAYDRYVSICRPLLYPSIMRRSRVSVLLVSTWFVAASHVAVPAILSSNSPLCSYSVTGIFCNNVIYGLQCVESRAIAVFGVVALVDIIILPVLFIVFSYTRILLVVFGSSRDIKRKAADTCLPHLLVLSSFFCLSIYDIIAARVESHLPAPARFIMTLQIVLYHPLFNPVVYGVKMKEISTRLRKLICAAKH
ncbi:olfactory receptor 11A1-like [Betta splendens]|uniref:Olfactory receptor n=1 Tax=Betta splendens TaxID=158456 RepID=A0A6P7LEP5_BETSP|nr:olfactory receptor 11A1-like [Betta splendens]